MRKPPNAADTSARSLSSTASSSDELAWSAYPLDIDTEYYCAVGEISHRWSWIERQCGVIVRETLGITKHAGWAVMSGVSVRVSGTILEALGAGDYLNKYPALKARVEVLGKRLGNIGEMRNQYAH